MANYTFEEIRLGLEIYGEFLIQEATDNNNKQLLSEIKLDFKGIKDLSKKALAKFKSLNTAEKTFVGLLGKLKKETNKDAKEILNFIKSKAKEYKGKSFGDLKADIEKITADFVGEKLDEAFAFGPKMKQLGGTLLLTIAMFNILGNALSQEVVTQTDLNNNNIEVVDDFDSNKISDDTDTTDWVDAYDAASTSSTGGDISYSDVQDGVQDQGVKVKLGNIGGAISFDTGEFDANQADIDEVAQDIVDDLEASLDGKDLKKISIDPFGLISNTPGDQDNNPNGPGDDGLDTKRLDVAKKIAKKIQDLLKDKYPDADVTIGDGTTNSDSVDGQKEVGRGSTESSSTQVAGVSLNDIETEDAPAEKDIVKPDVAKARLIDPKLELEDKSRYRALLSLFLPLLIDNYEATMEKVSVALQLEDSDFPITRKKMEVKLKELKNKENKDENDELAIKILEWSIGTSKSPSTLLNNINRLDSKVALGKRQLKKSIRPGQRGKNMGIAGTGKTQGNTGDQVTSPASGNEPGNRGPSIGSTVGESILESLLLILEAKTDFTELPNYNSSKAKSNLGILVPLYSAYWASEPGKTADGTTLPTGFDIDYVMDTYKDSWRKFERDYPVIVGKVKFDDYVDYIKGGKDDPTSSDKKDPTQRSFDKDPDLEPDTNKIKQSVDNISVLTNRLKLINNKEELQKLILAVVLFTNKNFVAARNKVVQALFKARNRFKPLKEDTPLWKKLADLPDNEYKTNIKVIDALRISKYLSKYPQLQNLLSRVNTEEELIELILNVILPYVNPTLHKNPTAIRSAIIGAANQYRSLKPGEELTMFLDKNLNERDLSKKVEKIAKSLPDAEFKKRYGKNWKAVKIATAEKIAEIIEEARTKGGKKVPQKYLKGLKSKGKYGSKEAMKREIDRFAGKDEYKQKWDADYTDSGKRVKTKQSAATKAFKKRFGESIESLMRIDENSDTALKNKAKKSGIPLSILRAVFRKGKAAWNTGHRPGTSQNQWAMGRVNSFITGSGGARKADAKLWARAKKARAKKRK